MAAPCDLPVGSASAFVVQLLTPSRGLYCPGSVLDDALRIICDCQYDSRIGRSRHLAFGNLALREDRRCVIAVDSRTTAARQLCRSKRGDGDKLERSHQVRWTDHRAPAVRPNGGDSADAKPKPRTAAED